jgi:hypothetical protein
MTPSEAGALMHYADDLADIRAIPWGAHSLLHRLVFRYRRRDSPGTVCVDLAELAGSGRCKDTIIEYIRALEAVHIIVKERWGAIVKGRWRQMPNRYHVRTVEEAQAAAEDAYEEPEYVLGSVSLPRGDGADDEGIRVDGRGRNPDPADVRTTHEAYQCNPHREAPGDRQELPAERMAMPSGCGRRDGMAGLEGLAKKEAGKGAARESEPVIPLPFCR